ncbi:unnamed protein product, partial [Acanthocheilonema viteae]
MQERPRNDAEIMAMASNSEAGKRPFKCDGCDRRFDREYNLTRHKMTHTGARPHQCNIC